MPLGKICFLGKSSNYRNIETRNYWAENFGEVSKPDGILSGKKFRLQDWGGSKGKICYLGKEYENFLPPEGHWIWD